MYDTSLPVPYDRILPAYSPVPQFVIPYNQPTQWEAYIPTIAQQCATIIGNNAQRNVLRVFSYNLFSANGWQNEAFVALVVFAVDYLTYLSETNQIRADVNAVITQVCESVVQGASAMNYQEYRGLQQVLNPNEAMQTQGAMQEFNQVRGVVGQHRNMKMQQQPMMQPQMGMPMMGMPQMGMAPGMMQPVMPGMGTVMIPGMQQVGMGADPRFQNGGVRQMPAQIGGMQQPMGGVRMGMPTMQNMYAPGEDQRELQKTMITRQREMMGGGGRWNKATDETIDSMQSLQAQQPGMVNAFERRMSAVAAETPAAVAAPIASHSTPHSTDATNTAMSTLTFQYPPGYFRNKATDSNEERAMAMTMYRRLLQINALPEGALTPYDTPPKPEPIVEPVSAAPIRQVETTAKTQREPGGDAQEGDSAASPAQLSDNAPQGAHAQASSGRWWDTEEYQIPDPIDPAQPRYESPITGDTIEMPTHAFVEEMLYDNTGHFTGPTSLPEGVDHSLEEEGLLHRWSPHEGQWYRPLYQPMHQERKLKVYTDGRPSDLIVLALAPDQIPNMDYAQHVLNSPQGRRDRVDADADRALAAQQKIKAATDAFYAGQTQAADEESLTLENPVTAFDVNLITEVEGAESTVWMINNVKRALREKESGITIDICVSNALLYEAVYCRNEVDVEFLKGIYRLTQFASLHGHLKENIGKVDKGVWELVNRRATAMLNQSLVLTMSLNEDVIAPDFFEHYPGVAAGIAQTPDVIKAAWEQAQPNQMALFFYEASEEDLKRNTDSVCYFLPDEKDAYLNATQYLASLSTFTQLSIDAADLDIALEPREVAQVTEASTPVLCRVAHAIFTSIADLGERKQIHHLLRTQDGVVYQFTFGALVNGSLLISKRQHLWVDAR
jgi:hypothetical protein